MTFHSPVSSELHALRAWAKRTKGKVALDGACGQRGVRLTHTSDDGRRYAAEFITTTTAALAVVADRIPWRRCADVEPQGIRGTGKRARKARARAGARAAQRSSTA